MTKEEAGLYCADLDSDARLMEVHTEQQLTNLRRFIGFLTFKKLMERYIILDNEGDFKYWLGATDSDQEGVWIWEDSLTPVDDFIWGDRVDSDDNNCMYLDESHLQAHDLPCLSTLYPLCQIYVY